MLINYCFDNIVVIDNIKRKSILLFSSKVKFIRKIERLGRGPGEYLSITDVIIVLDENSKKLILYDLKGKYIREQKMFYATDNVSILNDGSFLFEQPRDINRHILSISEFNLIYVQKNLKITGKDISYCYRDKFPKNTLSSIHSFNITKNGLLFNPLYSDTIYEIRNNNKISAKYNINLGDKNIRLAFNKHTTNKDRLNLSNTQKYYFFDGKSLESDNYLYFDILGVGSCYYSRKKEILHYGSSWRGG